MPIKEIGPRTRASKNRVNHLSRPQHTHVTRVVQMGGRYNNGKRALSPYGHTTAARWPEADFHPTSSHHGPFGGGGPCLVAGINRQVTCGRAKAELPWSNFGGQVWRRNGGRQLSDQPIPSTCVAASEVANPPRLQTCTSSPTS
eukprot:scaffold66842_cov26-Tisochrysis_lutea.AAC.2